MELTPPRLDYLLTGVISLGIMLSIWPGTIAPAFPHDDAVAHLLGGFGIALMIASVVPKRDDMILLAVLLMGAIWEPAEAYWFGYRTVDEIIDFMLFEDTLFDIALVFIGGFLALLGIRRYR